jgi:hypothetical protein
MEQAVEAFLASREEAAMSFVVKLMIVGWGTTLGMIAVCALKESGKLLGIRKRIAAWLHPSRAVRVEESEIPDTVRAD